MRLGILNEFFRIFQTNKVEGSNKILSTELKRDEIFLRDFNILNI